MAKDLKADFWKRIDDVQAGLLTATGERPVPMAPQADPDNNAIWFITAAGTAPEKAAHGGAEAAFYVADPKANIYADVEGRLEVSNDSAKLDEVWNAFAAAWFEDGREDKDVRLIKLTPKHAEVWLTENSAAFLYEVAKANLSDDTPDGGEHGQITF